LRQLGANTFHGRSHRSRHIVFVDWESGYKRFVATKIWTFGMEPEDCPAFLQDYDWQLIEDVGYDELANRYIGPTGRSLASTQVERMVYAQKT